MSDNSLLEGWPAGASVVIIAPREAGSEPVAHAGDLLERRPWASVSKMAVSWAMGVEVDSGRHHFNERIGPDGATLANLLSHSSGLGLEEHGPVVPIETKRVYSNCAVDHAVAAVVGSRDPSSWLDERVFQVLAMRDSALEGRAAAGVVGSTNDLVRLASAWLDGDGLSRRTRDDLITPYLPDLDGIVPGFGRFSPCPWGLGPEVRGQKHHWMGDWPPDSFGHFGQSGALMLLNANEGIGLVATSSAPFGPWAVKLWPHWTSAMRQRALAA